MANPFCILPQHADAFLAKVKSGEFSPDKLAKMESEDRRAAFAEIMGDAAAEKVNASFESRLLLKSQQKAITDWIDKAGKQAPETKRDLLSRVDRMQNVLSPQTAKPFLADLAKQRLGFGVTQAEAAHITTLARDVATSKAQLVAAGGDKAIPTDKAGIAAKDAYGHAKVAFGKYVSELKQPDAPTGAAARIKSALTATPGFSKAIKAAFDDSALLRQGWKTLFTNPIIWGKNAIKSFTHLAQQFGGKEVMDEVNAEIQSRPNALNGRYDKAKLALGNIEEQFPTTLPEKIPLVGRAYKASEAAFTAFQYQMRADVFDRYVDIAERQGRDVNDRAELEAIGKLANSLTARGHLGKLEPVADVANVLLFSGRKLKSDIDLLTLHAFDKGITPFARKQAATNALKVVGGTAGVLMLAHAVNPDAVEFDPRSANFGKIKVHNTRFDVTGGIGSIAILAARMALVLKNAATTNKTPVIKSSTTGKLIDVNTGKFGSKTGGEILTDFLSGKLSPVASLIRDVFNGEDYQHNKLTPGGEAANLLEPLPSQNLRELINDPATPPWLVLAAAIMDALGMSTNTYSNTKPNQKKGGSAGGSHSTPITIP